MTRNLCAMLVTALPLVGCNYLTGTPSGTKVAPGQLFCAVATQAGPLVVMLENTAGVPVVVTGLESTLVANFCKQWNVAAVPVAPATTPVPTVAVVVPPLPKT